VKVAILAGGLGTRLSEETNVKPKPMVEIGHCPILWHIMKGYTHYGFNEFVIALGYKGEFIKDYFVNYRHRAHDLTVDLASGDLTLLSGDSEKWMVHLLDTGLNSQTGGRVKKVAQYIGNEPFLLTYGDGVSDIDIQKLLTYHKEHGKMATITAVHPTARFGSLHIEGDTVKKFAEKPQIQEGWINGGFFVLEPGVADYIEGDDTHFEREPLERLAEEGQLMVYRHNGFWQCMDTLRDLRLLENLWETGKALWKVW